MASHARHFISTTTTRGTHQLRLGAVSALRRAQQDPRTQSVLLLCLVEDIHDRDKYAAYVSANNTIMKPYVGDFAIVARSFTEEMDNFRTLACTLSVGAAPVARMPFVLCKGIGLLGWLLSDEYLETNLDQRHASSGHTNVYVVTSASDDILGGGSVDALRTEMRSAPLALVVLEAFRRGGGTAPLHAALVAQGGVLLLECESESGGGAARELRVFEGDDTEALELWRLPSFAAIEACAASDVWARAVEEFERAGGQCRAVGLTSQ